MAAEYAVQRAGLTSLGWWSPGNVRSNINVEAFRDDNLFVWQRGYESYEDRLCGYAAHVQSIDTRDLLGTLREDGAFGARTAQTRDGLKVSRDLLDSVVELYAFERLAGLMSRPGVRVLDIGAGYGRFAHRAIEAGLDLGSYRCLDGVPLSTAICEYYTTLRELGPSVSVVDAISAERAGDLQADVAIAVHSLSEMPLRAVAAWLGLAARAGVQELLIVPNEHDVLESIEPNHTRMSLEGAIFGAGFQLRDTVTLVSPADSDFGPVDRFGRPDVAMLFTRA